MKVGNPTGNNQHDRNRANLRGSSNDQKSNTEVARMLNVSPRTIQLAKKVLHDGVPELFEALADPANEGKSNRQIAEEIGVASDTVDRARNGNSSEIRHHDTASTTKAKPSDEPTNPADDIDIETQSGREGRKKRGDG